MGRATHKFGRRSNVYGSGRGEKQEKKEPVDSLNRRGGWEGSVSTAAEAAWDSQKTVRRVLKADRRGTPRRGPRMIRRENLGQKKKDLASGVDSIQETEGGLPDVINSHMRAHPESTKKKKLDRSE